jgi:hypothetical protein
MKNSDLSNEKLAEVKDLIARKEIFKAFYLLQKMKEQPIPEKGAWLEWAQLSLVTPFSFLGLIAARKELEFHQNAEAQVFIDDLITRHKQAQLRSSKDYPLISLAGIVLPGSEKLWKRCLESISLQFNTRIEVKIFLDPRASGIGPQADFVSCTTLLDENRSITYSQAIKDARGEIFGMIEDPSSIFSDHGMLLVAAAFKTNQEIHVTQTERLTYGVEGVATPIRHELPLWSQALLNNPICLEAPSMAFDWRGVFFRRKTLIDQGLPLDNRYPFATAFDAVTKIARSKQIHSLRVPVVVDDCPLYARSYQVSLAQINDSTDIIDREKRLSPAGFSLATPEIVEIRPKTYNYHKFPRIDATILSHGEKCAPKITIVTTVLNDKTHIARCIESVLSQNYPNLEYIVLDGGSTDGTKEIIERYRKFLSQYHSCPDAGHYAAIQRGLRSSSGEIMSWINSDDLISPYSLRLVASIFTERKEIDWLTGKICMTSEQKDLDIASFCHPCDARSYYDDAFDRPYIQQEGTFWRRSLWERAGASLDLRLSLAADMELWTRFFQHAYLYTTTVPLGVFMMRKGQRSAILRNQYTYEAYSVIQRLQAGGIKPISSNQQISTILNIPLEKSQIEATQEPINKAKVETLTMNRQAPQTLLKQPHNQ